MKVTVDITDALLDKARKAAREEGKTLRSLVEEGLGLALARRAEPRTPFRLRDASVSGEGLRPEVRGAGWEQLRDLAYGDRA